jgi:hypothetical protein
MISKALELRFFCCGVLASFWDKHPAKNNDMINNPFKQFFPKNAKTNLKFYRKINQNSIVAEKQQQKFFI